ncbi:MAG: SH3 domain-containing protein [bacterium]|nr:SH3 domain-containing protein [bacterium]
MSNTDYKSTWETVNSNLQEIERLLAQGKYNSVMVKSRQTLEYMVRALADRACIVDGDLSQMIDELYNGNWISKETMEHYHQLRLIGTKAVNEGYASATDANRCHQILSQESHIFSHTPQRRRQTASNTRSTGSAGTTRRRRKKKTGTDLLVAYALRVVIPLVILILIIFLATRLVKVFSGDKESTDPSQSISTDASVPSSADISLDTTEPSSEPETPPAAAVTMYRAITTVNVRPEPNTATDRIGKLSTNDTVEFVRDYDDSWVVVKYNGQEAYVAKQYLVPVTE